MLLVNVTHVISSLSGDDIEPGRIKLCGVIVFICAVSLYIVIVANPFALVVPNTLLVLSPVAPLKLVAVNIAAPDETTLIY